MLKVDSGMSSTQGQCKANYDRQNLISELTCALMFRANVRASSILQQMDVPVCVSVEPSPLPNRKGFAGDHFYKNFCSTGKIRYL